ncbi:hypothetical protein PCE1_004284 [Barthelona sp. PCE]
MKEYTFSIPNIEQDTAYDELIDTLMHLSNKENYLKIPNLPLQASNPHLKDYMRYKLFKWGYGLLVDFMKTPIKVFALANMYFDSAVSTCHFRKQSLQLVYSACILLAHKFSIDHITLKPSMLVSCSCNTFELEDLLHMESKLFKLFDFRLNLTTVFDVINVLSVIYKDQFSNNTRFISVLSRILRNFFKTQFFSHVNTFYCGLCFFNLACTLSHQKIKDLDVFLEGFVHNNSDYSRVQSFICQTLKINSSRSNRRSPRSTA